MAKMKRQRKECKLSEADMASLSQRYPAVTVLGLLQEVAQFVGGGGGRAAVGGKIDWEALAKSTTTGISNPREYQMLWRHLAYRHSLIDCLGGEAQPLDDDSDLECEVEAFPNAGNEASSEAAAFAKVLMASGPPNDSSHLNGSMIEAPLTINIPCTQAYGPPASESSQHAAMRGMNITVPVFVPKVPLTGGAASGVDQLDANGSSDKKKRKAWTKEEDVLLIEAVKEFGAGNWEPMKEKTGLDRTTTQLSQRWAHLRRKKPGACNLGRDAGAHLFEQQQAARHAMNLALDPRRNSILNNSGLNTMASNPLPCFGSNETSATQHQSSQNPSVINQRSALDKHTAAVKSDLSSDPENKTARPTGARNSQLDALLPAHKPSPVCTSGSVGKPHSTSDKNEASVKSESSLDVARAAANATGARFAAQSSAEPPASRTEALIAQHLPLHPSAMSKASNPPTLSSVAKPHLSMDGVKTIVKSDLSSDPVRAAAVAAGARIATASDAATLFKAAQAKNAVHIISTGSIKSSTPGCPTVSETQPGTCHNSSGSTMMPLCVLSTGLGKASVISQPTSPSLALPSASLEGTGGDTSTTEGMKNFGQDVAQDSQVPGGKDFISANRLNEKGEVDAGSQIREAVLGSHQMVASSSNASTKLDILEGNLMQVDGDSVEDIDMEDVNETLVVLAKESENHSEVVKPEEDERLSCKHTDIANKGNEGSCGESEGDMLSCKHTNISNKGNNGSCGESEGDRLSCKHTAIANKGNDESCGESEGDRLSCKHTDIANKGNDGSCGKSEGVTTAAVINGLVKEQS